MSRGATWLGGLGIAGAGLAVAFRRIGDFDLPWHLATGRTILESGIPRVDPFSIAAPPMGHIELVTDSALYLVQSVFGALGLQALRALVVVAIALLVYRAARRGGAIAWFCVGISLAAMNAWLLVRPATFGFLFTAVSIWAIDAHAQKPETRHGVLALALLVPVQLLWANSHGSLILGAFLAGGYAFYRVASRLAAGRLGPLLPVEDGRGAWLCAAIAVLVAVVSGFNTAGYAVLTGGHTAGAASMFTEWAGPTVGFLFVTEPATGLLLAVSIAALAFGRGESGSRVPTALEIGLVAIGLVLSVTAVRLIAFAAILLAYVIARRLAFFDTNQRRTTALGVASVLLLGPLMLARSHTGLGVGLELSHYPSGAVEYIRTAEPQGQMWNFLPFGGYLIWQLHPRHKVLVDGRTGWVHPTEHVARAVASDADDAVFAALAAELDLQWAVTRSREGEPFGGALHRSSAWTMVFFDDVGSVYVRRDGPNRGLANSGYRWFRHLTPPQAVLARAMAPGDGPDLVHDAALALEQAPTSPRAAFLSACAGIASRDPRAFSSGRSRLVGLVGQDHASVGLLDMAWNDVKPDR